MDDIVKLYQGVTGQSVSPTDPIIPLGKFLGNPVGTVVDIPKLRQAAGEALPGFNTVADAIPIGQELYSEEYTTTSLNYVNGVGWVVPEDAKTDFTKDVLVGKSPFADAAGLFRANAAEIEHKAVSENPQAVAKVHIVGWCSGGVDNRNMERGMSVNRSKEECAATGGEWKEKEMTDNEVKIAGSLDGGGSPTIFSNTSERLFATEPIAASSEPAILTSLSVISFSFHSPPVAAHSSLLLFTDIPLLRSVPTVTVQSLVVLLQLPIAQDWLHVHDCLVMLLYILYKDLMLIPAHAIVYVVLDHPIYNCQYSQP
jgi:hypothetical protein